MVVESLVWTWRRIYYEKERYVPLLAVSSKGREEERWMDRLKTTAEPLMVRPSRRNPSRNISEWRHILESARYFREPNEPRNLCDRRAVLPIDVSRLLY